MNKKTANLSICEMRKHLFERIEFLYDEHKYEDGNALANEWLLDGRTYNPDNDETYEFCVDTYHKKVRKAKYKKFTDLEF